MAYNFTASASDYLLISSAPVINLPLTLACWMRTTQSVTNPAAVLSLGVSGQSRHYALRQGYSFANGAVAVATNGTTDGFARATTGMTQNVWGHIAGIFTSTTSRTVYWNGGSSATNTTSVAIGGTPNSLLIGARYNPSINAPFDGDICEVGVWDIALTATDITSLANGVSCSSVRPDNLVFHAPLIRDLINTVGGLGFTNQGTTATIHPRIYY